MKIFLIAAVMIAVGVFAGCGGTDTNTGTNANLTASPAAANTNPALKTNIENALRAKGFTNVTVDVSTTPATLRGSYPKGRLAEVIQTAQAANDMKPLQNQMSEEN